MSGTSVTASHVQVDDVGHRYGGRDVLDGINLLVQGGLVALLGANGAGKTTLLRCVSTTVFPNRGRVVIDGLTTTNESERVEVRRRLGYLPQTTRFAARARVFDVIDHVAVLKGHRDERNRRHMVFGALAQVGLDDRASERVGQLSGGMQQRLSLAQAFLGDPSLLVLDEPVAGLDPDERQRVRSVLTSRRRDATTIVSTHLIDEAADADVIWVLHNQRIVFADSPARLAGLAVGRTWTQHDAPPPNARASWMLADGSHRCLGTPPPRATLVDPRVEDGYLLLTA